MDTTTPGSDAEHDVPTYNGVVIKKGNPHPEDIWLGTSTATNQDGTKFYMHYDRANGSATFEKHREEHKHWCPYCAYNEDQEREAGDEGGA